MSHARRRVESDEAASGRKMTFSEWAAMPEDEPGELVDGCLVEEEMPDMTHERVVSWVNAAFNAWADRRGGAVFGSEVKFVVSPKRGRKPDLSVYVDGTKALPARGAVRVPPDIMVEVVSPTPGDGRRDRVEKADEYAAFGVRYYWIVDPEQRTIEILERERGGRYVRARSFLGGVAKRIPGCPGLSLDIDGLWARLDRLT